MNVWRRAGVRTVRVLGFAAFFGAEFLRSNATVAWEILTPGDRLAPAVLRVPLRSRTPREVACLVALVTLTPGTLALRVDGDPPVLALHGMHARDVEAFRAKVTDLEERMLAALRPVGGDGR
ncbi:MAG TPA: Na+/H+ antiporter subunit E [Pseudonocardia sp.]|nr:Na+/H+ antiporter subunit E [Pseudonocardia sp.]